MKLVKIDHTLKDEAQFILELLQNNYAKVSYPPTLDSILSSTITYFRVFDKETCVGISGYKMITPTLYETVKTVVASEFRGQGYGYKISQLIEDEVIELGAKKILTTIYEWNTAMINIKLKQGYRVEGYHPDHEAPGFHEYSLGKVVK